MTVLKISKKLLCPYCNAAFGRNFEIDSLYYNPPEIATCCVEEGGCGKYFVVYFDVTVNINTSKIELFVEKQIHDSWIIKI